MKEELLKVRHGLVSDEVAKMLIEHGCDFFRSVVTQARAAKWLREQYHIHIQINYDYSQLWGFSIYHIYDDKEEMFLYNDSMFKSYEEALNEGIKQVLRMI